MATIRIPPLLPSRECTEGRKEVLILETQGPQSHASNIEVLSTSVNTAREV